MRLFEGYFDKVGGSRHEIEGTKIEREQKGKFMTEVEISFQGDQANILNTYKIYRGLNSIIKQSPLFPIGTFASYPEISDANRNNTSPAFQEIIRIEPENDCDSIERNMRKALRIDPKRRIPHGPNHLTYRWQYDTENVKIDWENFVKKYINLSTQITALIPTILCAEVRFLQFYPKEEGEKNQLGYKHQGWNEFGSFSLHCGLSDSTAENVYKKLYPHMVDFTANTTNRNIWTKLHGTEEGNPWKESIEQKPFNEILNETIDWKQLAERTIDMMNEHYGIVISFTKKYKGISVRDAEFVGLRFSYDGEPMEIERRKLVEAIANSFSNNISYPILSQNKISFILDTNNLKITDKTTPTKIKKYHDDVEIESIGNRSAKYHTPTYGKKDRYSNRNMNPNFICITYGSSFINTFFVPKSGKIFKDLDGVNFETINLRDFIQKFQNDTKK